MNFHRYLKEENIDLHLAEGVDLEPAEGEDELTGKKLERAKEAVIEKLAALLEKSGKVSNETKLKNDLWNREKKASMALGQGIAIPHVRTMQARELAIAVGIARDGIPWGAPDGEPVKVFISMVAPPYEDKLYLQVYKRIGEIFSQEDAVERLLACEEAGELIRFLAKGGD